jgi:hypothetical protein
VAKRNINIDRLQIRLSGVSSQSARSVANGIGAELLGQLSAPGGLPNQPLRAINKIDAGRFPASAKAAPSELRELIARRIAESIRGKLGYRS